MLSLNLKSGEYITLGDNIVVQIFQGAAHDTFRVGIDAPREVTILRGSVLEREKDRPDSVRDSLPRHRSPADRKRSATQQEKVAAKREFFDAKRREAQAEKDAFLRDMRALLEREKPSREVEAMRARLEAFADSEIIV